MFCPNCGNQLPDGAQFCNKCGASIGGAAPNKAPRAKKPFALPTESEKFKLVFNLVAALFIFLPWIRGEGTQSGISFIGGLMFDVNALYGICKIFLILGLVAFAAYVAASYIDLAKFGMESALIKTFALLGFYGAYALSILFSFIGAFVKDFGYYDATTLNTVWYFALVIAVVGALINFIPKKSK